MLLYLLQNKVIKLNKDVLLKTPNNPWKTSVKERKEEEEEEKGKRQKEMSEVIKH